MEAYSGFAEVYDLFMDNVPYEDWCRYLTELLRKYGVKEGLVLDLPPFLRIRIPSEASK